jgi:pyruvate/2-oxoglutarate/acetoin dehydrogenase E1 component
MKIPVGPAIAGVAIVAAMIGGGWVVGVERGAYCVQVMSQIIECCADRRAKL